MQTREEKIIALITQARDALSIYLGKSNHYYSEQDKSYFYYNDTSGRLTDLQSLVGDHEKDGQCEEKEVKRKNITLYLLIQSPKLINALILTDFIENLRELSDPIPGFPPNPRLKSVIQKAIGPLEEAREMVSMRYWLMSNTNRLYSFFTDKTTEKEEKPVLPTPIITKKHSHS